MSFSAELANLLRRCDAFAADNRAKAARNLSNTGIYLVTDIAGGHAYPLHWLLHVRGDGKSFDDDKRSNQSLRRHIPDLHALGYVETYPDEPGFDHVWEAVLSACNRLGTAPSSRTAGPDWTGRRFFARQSALAALTQAETIDAAAAETARQYQRAFQTRIARAQADRSTDRRNRLREAPAQPQRSLRVVETYHRNPDVVAERLHMAKGICEECGAPAPFVRRTDGTAYLEVHHIVPLGQGGDDTLDNTRALCPNCHRRAHHG